MPTQITIENLILIANYIVLPQWILMILLPKWSGTQKLIDSYIIPFLLGALYFYFFIIVLPKFRDGYSMVTFLRILFSGRRVFLVLWLHILIFDLLVGAWICQDSIKSSVSWYARMFSLILVLFTGPIGFLFYQGVVKSRSGKK
jgi:hypothetical protein